MRKKTKTDYERLLSEQFDVLADIGFCGDVTEFFLERRDQIVADATEHQMPFLVVPSQGHLLPGIIEERMDIVPIENNPHRWRGSYNGPYVIQDIMMSIINAPMSCEQGYQNVPQKETQPFNVGEACHLARQRKSLGLPASCTIFALGSICPSANEDGSYEIPIVRVNGKEHAVLDSVTVDQFIRGPIVIPMSKIRTQY